VSSALGGFQGRPVKVGDRIPLSAATSGIRARSWSGTRAVVSGGARLRILPGPQADFFAPSALDALQRARYAISPQSDRMGYRLTGGSPDALQAKGEMISDATVVGAVQVPPSGQPILLMADRQTTGGYPQIAVVITADLPLAAQLAPGDWIEFELCSRTDAVAALAAQESPRDGGE
jgi:allophanate hydrolase subunit 2